MIITYDTDKLKELIDDLHSVTGISIAFINDRRCCIYSKHRERDYYCSGIQRLDGGRQRCRCSDADVVRQCAERGEPVAHICHAGLIDVAVPVVKNGISAGFVIFGRMRMGEMSVEQRSRLSWLGELEDEVIGYYNNMETYNEDQIKSLSRLISRLLFDEVIEIKHDSLSEAADAYIDANMDKAITLSTLCKALYVSKNRLYDEIAATYGMTVNEYIIHKKLDRAKRLLTETKIPIIEISSMLGMSNRTYFFKLFKRKCGITPTEYRSGKR